MGYLVSAEAHGAHGEGDHYARIRWRSDDPWGAIIRAVHDAVACYLPRAIDVREARKIAAVTLFVEFVPDKEDAERQLQPALYGDWWSVNALPLQAKGGF